MNKRSYLGIIAIATTMLGAMLFSSCSHDEFYYSEEKAEQSVNDKYAAAFEKAFGKVGPNVDWGFSSKNAGTRAVTRSGVTFNTTIEFPSDCDPSKFLAAVPTGVDKLPDWGGNAGLKDAFYIDEAYNVHIYNGAAKLYVKGDIDLSEGDTNPDVPRFQVSTTSEIYLLEGATLKIGEVSAEKLIGAAIYIAEGATLTTDYPLLLNSGIDVYNHGTINVKDLQVNTNSILYNSGTVKATGTISAESNSSNGDQSTIVNNGTIECKDVVVNAGAVLNILEWTVSGTTKINSNNSGWINNGQWKTKDYAYIGGSENVINNCYLWVTNDFEMNISSVKGSFKINSEGGVLAQKFYGGRDSSTGAISGPFKIEMAENAVFVVENDAQLEASRDDDKGFGIFGPASGEYAVFQAKNIVRNPYLASINSHGAVAYGGNLYVSAETHFKQGYDSDGTGTYTPRSFIIEKPGFSIDNNIYGEGFNSGKPNINIPETPCSPGFQGGDPLYRVIAEDLSASDAGDFDFNDVVFDVVKAEGGVTTLKLICAGGVLPLRVMGIEVHGLFGETKPNEKGEYKMYNTDAGPNVDPVTFEINGEFTTPEQIKNIIIEVYKEDKWMELKANTGEAACKILVDDTFKPVTERKNIADENGNFTDYVQGKFVNDFWWK